MSSRVKPGRPTVLVLFTIVAIGVFLRLPSSLFNDGASLAHLRTFHPQPGFTQIGFDENLYRGYVEALSRSGLTSYPDLSEQYVGVQGKLAAAILPPTRFIYIFCAYLWQQLSGTDALQALKMVSSLFSILTLVLSCVFATRMAGSRVGLCTTALMAFAPTQIHMSQHALIDGVFAFFALLCLWLLWETLQHPNDWKWLIPYGISLALLVLTKENALFAYVGLIAALGGACYFQIGKVTRLLLAMTVIGPLLGVAILVNLCGSLATTIHIYQLLVTKAAVLPYAIKTGDGPWYRYFVDLMLVSPLVFILALAAIFTLQRAENAVIFVVLFVAASFLVMCNVRYGMNLRYANMWDLPLCFLAAGYLVRVSKWLRRPDILLSVMVTLLCVFSLRQYQIFFVTAGLYELVPEGLLRAVHILK